MAARMSAWANALIFLASVSRRAGSDFGFEGLMPLENG
jgi:hypothetical protein